MKRLIVRLSIVGVIIALGVVAITQAQRLTPNTDVNAAEDDVNGDPQAAASDTPKPIPVRGEAMGDGIAASDLQGGGFLMPQAANTVVRGNNDDQKPAARKPAAMHLSDASQPPSDPSPGSSPAPFADPYGLRAQAANDPTGAGSPPPSQFQGGLQQSPDRAVRFTSSEETDSAPGGAAPTAPVGLAAPEQSLAPAAEPLPVDLQNPAPPSEFKPAPPKEVTFDPRQAQTPAQAAAQQPPPIAANTDGAQLLAPPNAALQAAAPQATEVVSERGGWPPPPPNSAGLQPAGGFAQPSAQTAVNPTEPPPAIMAEAAAPQATPVVSPAAIENRNPASPPNAAGNAAAGVPGDPSLEGPQAPAITLEKTAPAELQVDKPATFEILVRNVGQVVAHDVTVMDQVPQGTRLIDATPDVTRSQQGDLLWQLGSMAPGEQKVIAVQLLPLEEGDIGSVAEVSFRAQASVRTFCTKPQLTVEHTAPAQVLIGESLNLTITLSNPGSGDATGVILEEDVPEGLTHAAGRELEYEVGVLRPGESRNLELTLHAEKPGLIDNRLLVRGDGNLMAQDQIQIEVIAPQLEVEMVGPAIRYLERQATYEVSVRNPGTAPAENIELITYLPKGLRFVATDQQGQYDSERHAVYWSLEQLPAAKAGNVSLTVLPIETGEQKLRLEGRAELGLTNTFEHLVQVQGLAELFFTVKDVADPIEVGSDTTYEVRVTNHGSKTDTNVQLAALLPAELQPVGGEGPSRGAVNGQQVVFEPLARLAPNDEAVFHIHARGMQAGDSVVRIQVTSDDLPKPVTKEENTRVYADK